MYAQSLQLADHVRHYSISREGSGWEVRIEEDRAVRRLNHYSDWHRVERALAVFEREIGQLTDQGWRQVTETGGLQSMNR
jgi:hypothetical protein